MPHARFKTPMHKNPSLGLLKHQDLLPPAYFVGWVAWRRASTHKRQDVAAEEHLHNLNPSHIVVSPAELHIHRQACCLGWWTERSLAREGECQMTAPTQTAICNFICT